MEKHIFKYLDRQNEVNFISNNYGIYKLSDKDNLNKTPAFGVDIIKELKTLFAIENEECKLYIHLWAKSKFSDVDLDYYWEHYYNNVNNFTLPLIRNILHNRTLASELIPVIPMSTPTSNTLFLDIVYDKTPKYKLFYYWVIGKVRNIYDKILK